MPQSEISTLNQAGVVYKDVGKTPGVGSTVIDGCSAGADGILDKIELTEHSEIGWKATGISGTFTSYDIALAPKNPLTPFNPNSVSAPCENVQLLYVSKNGVPSGTPNVISGTQDWPTTSGNQVNPQTSISIAGVTGFGLTGMTSFSSFGHHTTTAGGVALPVELLYLSAYGVQNEFIKVDWATATEINNEGFELQRSNDGLNFENITFVNGAGNSTQVINYSFDDYEVNQNITYYYRLKQIDFNGDFEYSNIVNASLRGSENISFNVYPNPNSNSNDLNLDIYSVDNTQALIQMYDMLGKIVYTQNISLTAGLNKTILNKDFLSSGKYFITINLQDKLLTKGVSIID